MEVEATPSSPMSFEDAIFMGRTGRNIPSTSINGHRTKTSTIVSGRNFDLDEEDWC